jgi:GNAT superfamily N-acetyltransferase
MLDNIHITRADRTDVDAVLGMVRDYHAVDHLSFNETIVRPILESVIANHALGRLFLIRAGDDVVGYVLMGFGFSIEYLGRDAWVDEFFVKDEWRSRGIGKQVLGLVKAEALRLGIGAVHLEVTRGNTRAQSLYEKSGFQDHDRTLMTWWAE